MTEQEHIATMTTEQRAEIRRIYREEDLQGVTWADLYSRIVEG